MAQKVQIGELVDTIMETLEDYADLAAEDVKQAVREAGETVKKRTASMHLRIRGIMRKAEW